MGKMEVQREWQAISVIVWRAPIAILVRIKPTLWAIWVVSGCQFASAQLHVFQFKYIIQMYDNIIQPQQHYSTEQRHIRIYFRLADCILIRILCKISRVTSYLVNIAHCQACSMVLNLSNQLNNVESDNQMNYHN